MLLLFVRGEGITPPAHTLFTRASGKATAKSSPSTTDPRSPGAGVFTASPELVRLRRKISRAQSARRVTCEQGRGAPKFCCWGARPFLRVSFGWRCPGIGL